MPSEIRYTLDQAANTAKVSRERLHADLAAGHAESERIVDSSGRTRARNMTAQQVAAYGQHIRDINAAAQRKATEAKAAEQRKQAAAEIERDARQMMGRLKRHGINWRTS